jgi:hypothetical protein
MIGVQSLQNLLVGLLPAAIFKHSYIHARRVIAADTRRQLHSAMHHIVVPHEPAHKPNHDDGRGTDFRIGLSGGGERRLLSAG